MLTSCSWLLVPFHVRARKESLLHDLRAWPPALETLLGRIDHSTLTDEFTRRLTLLRMNYLSTLVNVSTLLQPCGTDKYQESTSVFRQVLSLAKPILCPATAKSRTDLIHAILINNMECGEDTLPILAFVAGAVQPLHMVADKCVDSSLCLEAIELLEERPWREGACMYTPEPIAPLLYDVVNFISCV